MAERKVKTVLSNENSVLGKSSKIKKGVGPYSKDTCVNYITISHKDLCSVLYIDEFEEIGQIDTNDAPELRFSILNENIPVNLEFNGVRLNYKLACEAYFDQELSIFTCDEVNSLDLSIGAGSSTERNAVQAGLLVPPIPSHGLKKLFRKKHTISRLPEGDLGDGEFELTEDNLLRQQNSCGKNIVLPKSVDMDIWESVSVAVSESTLATNKIPVSSTVHLCGRMRERGISNEQLQRCVKHGLKRPLPQCGLVLHQHEGIEFITNESWLIGVTAYHMRKLNCSAIIPCPLLLVGVVIGIKGATIKGIKSHFQVAECRVWSDNEKAVVVVRGNTFDNVRGAAAAITELTLKKPTRTAAVVMPPSASSRRLRKETRTAAVVRPPSASSRRLSKEISDATETEQHLMDEGCLLDNGTFYLKEYRKAYRK